MGLHEFMDENTHANLIADSTSPSMFVGNILLAVFTKEVLLVSTITGRGSNHNTKKKAIISKEVVSGDETEDETTSKESRADRTGGDDESMEEIIPQSPKDGKENKIRKLNPNKVNACKGKLGVLQLI